MIRAEVCSATCALKWFYAFTALQGTRIAFGVQQKISSVKNAIADLLKG